MEISLQKKTVRVSDGEVIPYERVICTLPLPRLGALISDLPEAYREIVGRLEYNTIWGVNIGINRPQITDKHWVYYPEYEYIFHRISFPMNFSASLVPQGCSSITAEVGMSKHKPINMDTLLEDVIRDLKKTGFVKHEEEIVFQNILELTPAYVVYHLQHREDVDALKRFLFEQGITACGRFGDWEYLNMDHSILSGKRAADDLNKASG